MTSRDLEELQCALDRGETPDASDLPEHLRNDGAALIQVDRLLRERPTFPASSVISDLALDRELEPLDVLSPPALSEMDIARPVVSQPALPERKAKTKAPLRSALPWLAMAAVAVLAVVSASRIERPRNLESASQAAVPNAAPASAATAAASETIAASATANTEEAERPTANESVPVASAAFPAPTTARRARGAVADETFGDPFVDGVGQGSGGGGRALAEALEVGASMAASAAGGALDAERSTGAPMGSSETAVAADDAPAEATPNAAPPAQAGSEGATPARQPQRSREQRFEVRVANCVRSATPQALRFETRDGVVVGVAPQQVSASAERCIERLLAGRRGPANGSRTVQVPAQAEDPLAGLQ